VPVLVFYLLVSLFAEPEGNWPIAGATTLLALGGAWASGALARPEGRETARRVVWRVAVVIGALAVPVLLRADVTAAIATRAVQMAKPESMPIRTGRLIGARAMGEHAARILGELDAQAGAGRAFVVVEHYGRASQLSYYLRTDAGGERVVYCASAAMGGRKSQFDLWARTDLRDPGLRGRDALLLSNDKPHTLEFWRSIFESVELIPKEKLDGEHKKDRVAYIGRGYRGLAPGTGERP